MRRSAAQLRRGGGKLRIIVKSLCGVQRVANGMFPGSRMSTVRHLLRGVFRLLRSEDFARKQKLPTTRSMAGVFPYTSFVLFVKSDHGLGPICQI